MHAWHIEPREYARQEERCSRRHAFAHLDPRRTALLVIDVAPFFLDQSAYCRGIVPNIIRLADRLRKAGGVVAWVLPMAEPAPSAAAVEFLGSGVAALYASSGGSGPLAARLGSGFTVHADDLRVEKSAASAFFPGRCALPALSAVRGIDTVLITGAVTNVCCKSTARDASTIGLRVIMVADANAARRDQDHNATLHTIYRSFGDVRPTAEVLNLIGG